MIKHDKFRQSLLDSGWCFSSVPRQSGGYFRYAQRHVRTVFICGQMPVVLLTGAVLGQGCCLPVVFTPVRTVQTVQKTRILQRSSGLVVDMPVSVQTTGLWSDSGENCGSAVAFLLQGGHCPWCAGRADSLVQVWRRQSYPTVAACPYVFLDKVVDMPSLCNGRCLVFGAKTADSPHLQFIDMVWTSLRLCSDVSCSGRCHRFSSSPDMVDIPVCTETVVRGCDA